MVRQRYFVQAKFGGFLVLSTQHLYKGCLGQWTCFFYFELVLDVFESFCCQYKLLSHHSRTLRHANCTGCRIKVTLDTANDI